MSMIDAGIKHSERELVWHGEYPQAVVERVRAEIATDLDDQLDEASDLCFHTVLLGEDIRTSPVVMVWGKEGDDRFHCEYHATPDWQPLVGDDEEDAS